jgi:hypothetical protein
MYSGIEPREGDRDLRNGFEIAATRRRTLFRTSERLTPRARNARPASGATSARRAGGGQERGERDPRVAAERPSLLHDEHAEHP